MNGRVVGTGTVTIEPREDAYLQRVAIEVERDTRYDMELGFSRARGAIHAEHYRIETRDGERLVAREEGWFRDVRALRFGGTVEPYPADLTPLLGCALGLRGLTLEKGSRRTIALWLANTVHWEIETRVEAREPVSVPVGKRDAWRVRARPSFEAMAASLDRLIGFFLPPFVLHFEAELPHRLLRFEFPTGPFPWNPRALVEATSLA